MSPNSLLLGIFHNILLCFPILKLCSSHIAFHTVWAISLLRMYCRSSGRTFRAEETEGYKSRSHFSLFCPLVSECNE